MKKILFTILASLAIVTAATAGGTFVGDGMGGGFYFGDDGSSATVISGGNDSYFIFD